MGSFVTVLVAIFLAFLLLFALDYFFRASTWWRFVGNGVFCLILLGLFGLTIGLFDPWL